MTDDIRPRVYAVNADDLPRQWKAFRMTWNEADAKSAIITVGGTVLGGLVLVLMIGLALPLARFFQGGKHPAPSWVVSLVVCFSVAIISYSFVKIRGLKGNPYYWVAATLGTFTLMFGLLVLVGVAAGIK